MKNGTINVKAVHAELMAGRREHERRVYQQRKEQGLCTRCGAPAAVDSLLCEPHIAYQRDQASKSVKKLRRKRRRAGLCEQCKRPSERWRCLICLARVGRLPRSTVDPANNTRNVNQNRRDADGKLRFHGTGKRGNQPAAVKDRWDLKLVMASVVRALEINEAIMRLGDVMTGDDRETLGIAKLDQVSIIARIAEEILERGRYDARSSAADLQRAKARQSNR